MKDRRIRAKHALSGRALLAQGAGLGRVPLWIPVLLLCVAELVSVYPVR